MRAVFMGTPDFAVESLKGAAQCCQIQAVFTQPDKPKGRGNKMTFPPVKTAALEMGIPVYQPVTLKNGEALEIIKQINPDIIIVAAYGKILPKEILCLPAFGCVNVHASLLPAYRGAAPIQWCILNGESKTGITIMKMDEGLDTGDMLAVSEVEISDKMTGGELHDALALEGARLLCKTLPAIENNTVTPVKQPEQFTYAPMLTKELCRIDFSLDAAEVHNKIRAFSPVPGAVTMLDGKRLKLFCSQVVKDVSGCPGEVVSVNPLIIACGGNTAVKIDELQLEGSRRMDIKTFLLGRSIEAGTVLSF